MNRLWLKFSKNISFSTFSNSSPPLPPTIRSSCAVVQKSCSCYCCYSCGCWLVGVELKIHHKHTHLVITLVSTFAIYLILPIFYITFTDDGAWYCYMALTPTLTLTLTLAGECMIAVMVIRYASKYKHTT